jgi:hypothetical protein
VRVVSFVGPDGPRLGLVEGDVVVDLSAVDPAAPRVVNRVEDEVTAGPSMSDARAFAQ